MAKGKSEEDIRQVVAEIKKLDVEVKVDVTIMNQEELQAFLDMEQESWKGGT